MAPSSPCVSDDQLARLAEGAALSPEQEAHLDRCRDCFELVAAAAKGDTPSPPPGEDRSAKFERFELGELLGQGGMGRVFSAYDPRLARKVAIKVLRAELFAAEDQSLARERLRREALAMARLRHPNVVHVYEVGEQDGEVFVVMELVRGRSIDAWVRHEHPSVSTIVGLFAAAARGLAAAHEAGLVHRDVKPSNLLVDETGHLRVLDFGLASSAGTMMGEVGLALPDEGASATQTGAVAGTVAYMAPERFEGAPATARSDQFSLCVSMYEILAGKRPYPPPKPGRAWPRPSMRPMPRRVRSILSRGLSLEPAQRFASMSQLADALDRSRSNGWGVAVAAGCLVALGGMVALQGDDPPEACMSGWAELSEVWNEPRAEAMRARLEALNPADGGRLAEQIEQTMDSHARRWSEARTRVCRRAIEEPDASDGAALEAACLSARLAELDALVGPMVEADLATLDAAQSAIVRWGFSACEDQESLLGVEPMPDDEGQRRAIAEARQELARASAAIDLGNTKQAATRLAGCQDAVEALGYPPLQAELELLRGVLDHAQGDLERATSDLHRALVAASRGHHERVQVEAHLALESIHLARSGELDDAQRSLDLAAAIAERLADPSLRREVILAQAGLFEERGQLSQALDVLDRLDGPEDEAGPAAAADRLQGLSRRTSVLRKLGRYAEAASSGQRAVRDASEHYGRLHPVTADAYSELAMTLLDDGLVDEALETAEETLRIRQSAPEHRPDLLARAHNDVGAVHWRRGELEAARTSFARALEFMAPDSSARGVTLDNLGSVYLHLGDFPAAEAQHRAAIEVLRAAYGSDHFEIALALHNLGETLYQQGWYDEAKANYEQALAVNERTRGEDHPHNALMLLGMAKCSMKTKHYAQAIPHLRRAIAIRTEVPNDTYVMGVLRYALAVATSEGNGDFAEARALVAQSIHDFELAGSSANGDRERALRWMDEHGEPGNDD